ncbi:unnamed protein product, partial [Iphiclides podalirius]
MATITLTNTTYRPLLLTRQQRVFHRTKWTKFSFRPTSKKEKTLN